MERILKWLIAGVAGRPIAVAAIAAAIVLMVVAGILDVDAAVAALRALLGS